MVARGLYYTYMQFKIYLLVLMILMGNIGSAHAQAKQGSSTQPALSAVATSTVPQSKTLNQQALSMQKQKRILNLAANISNTLEAAIARLDSISERITKRITLMEQNGFEINAAKAKLSEAQTSLATARNLLKSIDAKATTVSSSEKPQEIWIEVRGIFKEAFQNIVTSKQSMHETVLLLKQSQQKQQTTGSSVPVNPGKN